jgi:hypothetical protein
LSPTRICYAYGVTRDEAAVLYLRVRGGCDACGQSDFAAARRLAIDHDHRLTGSASVRGVLCSACNRAVGMVKDNPARLRALAAYLENPPGIRANGQFDDRAHLVMRARP